MPLNKYQEILAPYFRLGSHDGVVQLQEVIVGATCAYAFFARHYGDMHSHVRAARRLKDTDAAHLFEQIASVVAHCHESGIVLRDLKLRKFVFKDPEKYVLLDVVCWHIINLLLKDAACDIPMAFRML